MFFFLYEWKLCATCCAYQLVDPTTDGDAWLYLDIRALGRLGGQLTQAIPFIYFMCLYIYLLAWNESIFGSPAQIMDICLQSF